MTEHRRGVAMGLAAYGCWGIFPLYWPLLRPAGAVEILAHRIVWSLVVVGLVLAHARRLAELRAIGTRRVLFLAIGAGFVAVNWGVYIWAVNAGHVVETALGYFVNPLVTVLLGVVALRERLRRVQWIAVVLAAVAVGVLAYDYGRLPWIALVLAFSFAIYGLMKKFARVGAAEGLAIETCFLFVPALAYLAWAEARGIAAFGRISWQRDLLLVSAGPITAVPLLFFAGATNRVPLSTVGLLQYLAPVLQFLCGVLVFHEHMPASRWLGFMLVWAALIVFAIDGTRAGSRASERA